ncbi:hydrogenase maturation protease [Rhodococcus zopfii]|uniref:hydrogenase maturation protease n=1 Tax=Rhodococcus zopfii TaxID=43772 RepID=UPI0009339457|nr:hydrogenase maturation protease [Rhodococcus zopfii]
MTIVVLGLGQDFRRDDGIGHAIAREVAARAASAIRVHVADGEPTRLLDAWDGAELAVLIDSVVCDSPCTGTVRRYDSTAVTLSSVRATSTHGLGLVAALELAALLDRLPRRWVLYTVEVADVGFGCGLSPAAARAIEPVVSAVLAEVSGG